jgi:6-phosphogluconolactonase
MKGFWQILLSLLLMLAMLFLVNCSGGAPGCPQASFGSSACSSSSGSTSFGGGGGTGGGGGGGGGGSTPTAFAYAVDQNGSIDGFTFSAGASTFGPTSGYTSPLFPANLGSEGLVVAQGQFLYAVLEAQQQIYGWTIGSDGSLTALNGFPMSVPISGIGINANYNQQVVITNPAGTLLFISEAGTEQILVYQISSAGVLTPVTGSPFSTLGQTLEPQNMATDGAGKFLYVTEDSGDHSGAFVTGYAISSTGVLTPLSTSQFNFPLWEMQGDSSGKYLVGITGETAYYFGSDDTHIHVLSINSTTGALTEVSGSPFTTTYAPFNIALQPSANATEFVYSFSIDDANTGANAIEGFQLDTTSGKLTAISGSPFGVTHAPWGQFDQTGQYLFFYAGGSPIDLGVFNVGSTGALTETVSATPLTTSGYWAVADVP